MQNYAHTYLADPLSMNTTSGSFVIASDLVVNDAFLPSPSTCTSTQHNCTNKQHFTEYRMFVSTLLQECRTTLSNCYILTTYVMSLSFMNSPAMPNAL
jgi:hypothetical protein